MTPFMRSHSGFDLFFLADHPQFIPTIAEWILTEWGYRERNETIESIISNLGTQLNTEYPPMALVGLNQGVPISCSSIKIRELGSFPSYLHWLASVYVLPEFRNQGIGSLVVEYSSRIASKVGIQELFLYTHSHEDFYSHLGYSAVERPYYQGREIVIMRRLLP